MSHILTTQAEVDEQFLISPSEVRGLVWVQEQHPNEILAIDHVRDNADVGWVVVRVRFPIRGSSWRHAVRDYWLSPTGRVFRGVVDERNCFLSHRTDEVLREADYDKVGQRGS